MSEEFIAAVDLLKALVVDPRIGVLVALLIVAAWIDVKSNRIPNWLVFGGVVFGLLYNGFFPVFERESRWLLAIGGLGVGLGMLLPFSILHAMGAGDVKLMAMVGAFLGPWHTFVAVLATFLAGGALAIGFLLINGSLRRGLLNMFLIGRGAMLDVAPANAQWQTDLAVWCAKLGTLDDGQSAQTQRGYLLLGRDILLKLKSAGQSTASQDWIGWFDQQLTNLPPGQP